MSQPYRIVPIITGPKKKTSAKSIAIGGLFVLGMFLPAAWLMSGLMCRSSEDVCEHYRQKAFNPMPDKAVRACTKQCDKGDADACSAVKQWARAAEESKMFEAALQAGDRYVRCGSRPESEQHKACVTDCEGGDVGACLRLGLESEYGNPSIDRAGARGYYARACTKVPKMYRCSTNLFFMAAHNGPSRPDAESSRFSCPPNAPTASQSSNMSVAAPRIAGARRHAIARS